MPNGDWNHIGPTIFFTTWETFQLEPWIADNASGNRAGPLAGWHTLVTQVGSGTVRYFVDGQPVAEHGLWFIRDGLIAGNDLSRWEEDIDWVYFRGRRPQSPQAVEAAIAALRGRPLRFKDTVPPSGLTSPCNF